MTRVIICPRTLFFMLSDVSPKIKHCTFFVMQNLRSILYLFLVDVFFLFTPYLNVIYTVTVKYKTSSFIDLVQSLVKSV